MGSARLSEENWKIHYCDAFGLQKDANCFAELIAKYIDGIDGGGEMLNMTQMECK